MKKVTFNLLFVLTVILLSSCKKEETANNKEFFNTQANNITKNSSISGNQTIYEVAPTIVANFQHYCQRNAGPASATYPNGTGNLTDDQSRRACGPTAYMMAANCIAKYINPYTGYSASGTKLAEIVSKTGVSTYLTDLVNYANNYDNSFLIGVYNGPQKTNRALSKQFIETALANNKFIITAVNARTYDYYTVNNSNYYYNNSSNPDLNASGDVASGTNKNYITTNTSNGTTIGGHIILIIRIVVNNNDGTGIVEYIDPLAITKPTGISNRRYVSYTRLLNSMVANGSPNYDAISIAQR